MMKRSKELPPSEPFGKGGAFEWPGTYSDALCLVETCNFYIDSKDFLDVVIDTDDGLDKDSDTDDEGDKDTDTDAEVDEDLEGSDPFAEAKTWELPYLVASAVNKCLTETISARASKRSGVDERGGTPPFQNMTSIWWEPLFPVLLIFGEPVLETLIQNGWLGPNRKEVCRGFAYWLRCQMGGDSIYDSSAIPPHEGETRQDPKHNKGFELNQRGGTPVRPSFKAFVKTYKGSQEGALRCLLIAGIDQHAAQLAVEEAFKSGSLVPLHEALLNEERASGASGIGVTVPALPNTEEGTVTPSGDGDRA